MKPLVCSVRLHEALKADPIAWAMLPFVGVQPALRVGAATLELRDCAGCHSTLCKWVSVGGGQS